MPTGLRTATAVVMLATLAVLPGAQPADAHTDSCSGVGEAHFGSAIGTWPVHDAASTVMSFSYSALAHCAGPSGWTATGPFWGFCNDAAGFGTTSHGHAYRFLLKGNKLVLEGGVVGVLTLFGPVFSGGSCDNKTLTTFNFVGSVGLAHP